MPKANDIIVYVNEKKIKTTYHADKNGLTIRRQTATKKGASK